MNLNEASLNALFIARVREENGADVKLGDIFKHMARHYAKGLAVVWVPGVSLAYR